ncbi:MAG: hypothetical protein JSV96_01540 [Candidatus Aminicenantes bacterium]|nr:MAG: hypothetical protein JSV96_01540 [Candidatus Aminicenantes bacterium]
MRTERSDSSRGRWVLISGLLLSLVALVLYGYRYNPRVRLQMCLDNPLKYDGTEIGVGAEAKVTRLLPDGFIVKELNRTILVKGNPQNASLGDFVRMRVIFHKEGYLELKRLQVAKRRYTKIVVSIAPALLVLFLLFRTYRFDWRLFLFKEKT